MAKTWSFPGSIGDCSYNWRFVQVTRLGYPLDFGEVVQVSDCLFLLLDPAKTVQLAQLKQFAKTLLKKHGVKPKDAGSGGTQWVCWTVGSSWLDLQFMVEWISIYLLHV